MKAVAPNRERAVWVKHTLLRPTAPRDVGIAEVWAIAFTRADGPIAWAKSVAPLADARFTDAPFSHQVGPCRLTATGAAGEVSGSGHDLSWSIQLTGLAAEHRPFPFASMYEGPFPRQKVLTPTPSATADGEVTVDGHPWAIEGWLSMQGHNWGLGHSERYAWVHCNDFDEGPRRVDETWLEVLTGRVRAGGVLLPWLSVGALCLEGEVHRVDGPRALLTRDLNVTPTRYRTRLRRGPLGLDLDVTAPPGAMAGVRYENPDGTTTHCLNSKLARGVVTLSRRGRPSRTLTSEAFALEVGTLDPTHGIHMRL